MSASRKTNRKPGKKSGARINNVLALKPLGIRNLISYELPTRAAILALENKTYDDQHLAHLYSLGDICRRIAIEQHIKTHAATVMRLCVQIHNEKSSDAMVVDSMRISANLLLEWMNRKSNSEISHAAHAALKELAV